MSILPTLCTYIGLPDSRIKSPGSLLKETNKSESTQQQIQRLVKYFKITTQPKLVPLNLRKSPKRANSCNTGQATNFTEGLGFSSSRGSVDCVSLNTSPIEEVLLLQKAIQILSLYGITLTLQINKDKKNEVNTILRHLVPELGFFSDSLIRKIDLREIIICDQEDLVQLQRKNPKSGFFTSNLYSQEEIQRQLQTIILNNIITSQANIVEEWGQIRIEGENSSQSQDSDLIDLQNVYGSLMENSNLALIKLRTEKLKTLLINYFPEEFSNEWFKNRNKEKKKVFRVQFNEETEEIYA
jgi:hypothetical protein